MSTEPSTGAGAATARWQSWALSGLTTLAVLALLATFALCMQRAGFAIASPFGIDYGEGIVWQQTILMHPGSMYGDITTYPYIVFEYPPLYSLIVRLLTALSGVDMLALGRGLSVLATLLCAGLTARLAWRNVGPNTSPSAPALAGLIAALSIFTWWAVFYWTGLMRIDFTAQFFTLLGLNLAASALTRPRLLLPAMLAFVAAVYTRQTEIIAPLTVIAIHLPRRPAATLRAMGIAFLVALVPLLTLLWLTDGGFLRHIVFYNVNQMLWPTALYALRGQLRQGPTMLLALVGLVLAWRALGGTSRIITRIRTDARIAELAMISLYALLLIPTLVTVSYPGGAVNYFIPIILASAPFVGIGAARCLLPALPTGRGRVLAACVAVLLIGQPILAHLPPSRLDDPALVAENTELLALFKRQTKPILADNMSMLVRAGQPIPIEPFIFAQLGRRGLWDTRLLIDRINAEAFALVQTDRPLANVISQQRYTDAELAAIAAHYPRIERLGQNYLYFPADR